MSLFQILALLLVLTAGFSCLNERFLRLPSTIGLMLIALAVSSGIIGLEWAGVRVVQEEARAFLSKVDFSATLLEGMLSFLLFAGTLHIRLDELEQQEWLIGALAVASTIIAAFLIGTLTWAVLGLVGLKVAYVYALIFGALISPTDPIAVLGILRSAGIPRRLEILISGESLFNDGVGVVLFVLLTDVAFAGEELSLFHGGLLFGREAVGGVALGLFTGLVAYGLLRSVQQDTTQVLITLATATGGYALADAVHVSGPIAVIVAGLLIGNYGRRWTMSAVGRQQLDDFWHLLDEVLNAVLFVLIGLELLVVPLTFPALGASLLAILVVLVSRFLSVAMPVMVLRLQHPFSSTTLQLLELLTWSGLRGGISVALALSLVAGPERDLLLTMTYAVVVFSILVQGLTVSRLFSQPQLKHLAQSQ